MATLNGEINKTISLVGEIVGTKGAKGDTGEKGVKGDTGAQGLGIKSVKLNDDYTLTIYYSNGTNQTTSSIRGKEGKGIKNIVMNNDDTLTIYYTDDTFDKTKSIKGDKGDQGIPGIQGPQGYKGDTGPKGDKGDKGDTGDSAYDIWLAEGHSGSKTEFINSFSNYTTIENKPKIAGVTLEGNKTLDELGIESQDDFNAFKEKINSDYYLKKDTFNRDEINELVSTIPKFDIKVVEKLPTIDISVSTIYLLKSGAEDDNIFTEYVYVKQSWEKLGTQRMDLSDYYTKEEVDKMSSSIKSSISLKADQAEFDTLNNILNNKVSLDTFKGLETKVTTNSNNISENKTKITNLTNRVDTLEGVTSLTNLDMDQIDKIAQSGNSARYFSIGNQIEQTWKETFDDKETSYTVPINMAHFGTYENENGKTKNGIYLEWNYTTPRGLAFCMSQSLQKFDGTDGAPNGLPAGKYCFYVGYFTNDWANARDIFKNKWVSFELTKAIPSGGVLCRGIIGDFAEWKIDSRTSCMNNSTLIEEVTMTVSDTQPDGYTNLGSCWGEDVGYGVLNHIECVAYGDNTWRDSDLRQWLNSDTDDWWKPLTRYNRQPAEATRLKGFLSGYSDEFKTHLKTVRNYEYINTLKEKEGLVYTDDKIFLHSPSQRNCTTDNGEQNSMTYPEGEPWQYYKELANGETNLEGAGRFKAWTKYDILKRYALNNQSSAQVYFSRSARRGYAYLVWNVTEGGGVTHSNARDGFRCLPACVI